MAFCCPSCIKATVFVENTILVQSYLSDRTQSVIVDGQLSEEGPFQFGTPEGSILGPILFTLYAAPIEDIIISYDLDLMLFADDSAMGMSTWHVRKPSLSMTDWSAASMISGFE